MIQLRIGNEALELTWEEWEQRVREGRVPADALVCFPPVTGEAFQRADELEIYTSLHDEERLAWQAALVSGGAPLLTALLVGVQIRIWWFARWPEVEKFITQHLTNSSGAVLEDGQVWRLLSMGFVHLDLAHIGLNMLWLGYCGWNLERALGRVNLFAIYLTAVLGGALLSTFGSPESTSIGASGGVFGLISASVAFGLTRPHLLPDRARQYLGVAMLPYLVVMFGSGLASRQIDNLAHFGGLLTGALLSVLLDPPTLQRSPGHNRRVLLGTAGLSALIMLSLALFGPRLYPVEDEADALRRQLRLESVEELPAADRSRKQEVRLSFDAPAGWQRRRSIYGEAAFSSQVGPRAWSVREWQAGAPADIADLRARWEGKLLRGFPDSTTTDPVPAVIAGREGYTATTTIPYGGEQLVLTWRVAIRGRWVLEEVWQVEAERASRLSPLVERLRSSVVWPDPEPLRKARLELDRTPNSRKIRRQHAQALTDVGEASEAVRAWRGLIAEQPADADAWEGLLRTARWYPEAVEDVDALFDDALAALPTADTTVRVVRALEDFGREPLAQGLLEAAWLRWPGDRVIRRARRARELPVALDVDRYLPPEWLYEPIEQRPLTDVELSALEARALNMTTARWFDAERERRRALLTERVIAAEDDDALLDALVLLWQGTPAEDREAARAGLAQEWALIAEGRDRPWLPEAAREALESREVPWLTP